MITGYDNLPIGKYQSILEALSKTTDDIDAHVTILSILNDMEMEEVYNLPLEKYAELSQHVSFLLSPLPPVRGRICNSYKCGEMVLIPTTNVKKFTAAQYIDYQQMLVEKDKIVELCSTLLVPEGHTYADGYDIADVHNVIADHLSVMDVMELSAFFLRKLKTSINRTTRYLEGMSFLTLPKKERKEIHRMMKEARVFTRDGGGLHK